MTRFSDASSLPPPPLERVLFRLGVVGSAWLVLDGMSAAVDVVVVNVTSASDGVRVGVDGARVGVDAADSESRLELRLTSRMPTRAFRVGVASYSSRAGREFGANGVVGRDDGGRDDDGIEEGESGESGRVKGEVKLAVRTR